MMQSCEATWILCHVPTAIKHGAEKDSETELSLAESELLPVLLMPAATAE